MEGEGLGTEGWFCKPLKTITSNKPANYTEALHKEDLSLYDKKLNFLFDVVVLVKALSDVDILVNEDNKRETNCCSIH